jgi:cytochrome c oxidase assembly protein subunit 11
MLPDENRVLRIKFNADTSATMRWNFRPLQKEVYLVPGETSLAFYTVRQHTQHV